MSGSHRLAFHVGALFVFCTAITAAYAEPAPVDDDTAQLAADVGVDPVALLGASLTTHLDPAAYLCRVGEGPCPTPPLRGAVAQADCIIQKESKGLDVPNQSGSGASGPGQYFPGTWATHVSLYRAATGFVGSLNLHVLDDVRRVMAYVLTLPGQRKHWTVGGC